MVELPQEGLTRWTVADVRRIVESGEFWST